MSKENGCTENPKSMVLDLQKPQRGHYMVNEQVFQISDLRKHGKNAYNQNIPKIRFFFKCKTMQHMHFPVGTPHLFFF